MDERGIFERIGEVLGAVIAWLSSIGGRLGELLGAFIDGVARGSGLEGASWLTWGLVLIGVLLVVAAVRRLIDMEFGSAIINAVIGLALIAWAMS